MLRKRNKGAFLIGALTMATMTGLAQQPASQPQHAVTNDLAVVANFETGNVAANGGGRFWLKGAGIDDALTFYHGLGVAVALNGAGSANIGNNVALDKIAVMFGPRYTTGLSHSMKSKTASHHPEVFEEALFGTVHAYNSLFPAIGGTDSRANAFSMQLGAGLDVGLKGGFGVRALEVDWVHTQLPNNASNSQNDFRLAFGISYRK